MNLRISENQLRFRITQGETELLKCDGSLSFALNLGSQTAEYAISLADLEQPLDLEVDKNAWKLLVDRKDFSQFIASLPSREGIEQNISMNGTQLTLVLEVDVRRKRVVA
ncbi:MAG: hypothetical protein AABY33_03960 [Pseudomonadota bacterium]